MDEQEWICQECRKTGSYSEIRTPIDKGVDCCPDCGDKVKCILCDICKDVKLVCESHQDKPWDELISGGCECGPGMPCICVSRQTSEEPKINSMTNPKNLPEIPGDRKRA